MTFVQSSISFGGYTFPAGFAVLDRSNDAVIDEIKVPFLDGTSAPPGSRNSKVLHVQGIIGGWGSVDSNGDAISTADECEAEVQTMLSYLESGYQALSFGQTPARYITAQKRKLTMTPLVGAGRRAVQVAIEFVAQDPRWLSSTPNTVSGADGWGGTAIANAGTAITYPKFTLTGAAGASNPIFKVTPSGRTGYIEVALTYAMGAGDQIVVDCDPRNRPNAVTINGVARLDTLGVAGVTNTIGDSAFMPYMTPGTNNAPVVAYAGTGPCPLVISWQDAWL